MLHLDPQTLRVLVAIEDHGSFSGAAAAVNLVPSAVSRRVQELEAATSLELVKRDPRRVEFTVAGQLLAERARRILAEIDAAVGEMQSFSEGVRGEVKVATSIFALHAGLPCEIAAFRDRHPRIDINLQMLASGEVIAALHRRKVDVGLFATSQVPQGLRTKVHSTDRMCLLVPARHRLARRLTVRFQDFAAEDLLRLPAGAEAQQMLVDQARRHGLRLRQPFQAGSLDAVVAMARAGLGLALVPAASWNSLGPFRGLRQVAIDETWSETQLLVATNVSLPAGSPGYRLFQELSVDRQI